MALEWTELRSLGQQRRSRSRASASEARSQWNWSEVSLQAYLCLDRLIELGHHRRRLWFALKGRQLDSGH